MGSVLYFSFLFGVSGVLGVEEGRYPMQQQGTVFWGDDTLIVLDARS